MTATSVFVSRPTSVDRNQELFCLELTSVLEAQQLRPRTLGVTDYPSRAPLGDVVQLMRECQGAVVLGLRQLRVQFGVAKEETVDQEEARNLLLPTAWNHIEAGMAASLGLPLLIIREIGVSSGVFDVGSSDRFVHQAEMNSDWIRSPKFLDPFRSWVSDVQREN